MKKSELRKLVREILLKEINTPWGRSDSEHQLDSGVTWYTTPGHGGLGVASGVAKAKLSPQALALGEYWGGYYWYEEDIAWTIPMYEHPEWQKKLVSVAGGKLLSQGELASTIKRWFPKYFESEFAEKSKYNLNMPSIKPNDIIYWKYGNYVFEIISPLGKTSWLVIGKDKQKYKISNQNIAKNVIKIVRDGRTIWEKK